MMSSVVEIKGLCKAFGSQQVLRDLDWGIPQGKVVGLLGRNGAGKSTLIECMLGLREADAGRVTLFGEDAARLTDAARGRIGYVPQSSELFGWMTPAQLLDYFRALYQHWNADKVAALLRRWGFDAPMLDKPIAQLSGGQKQRLSIIRALAHEPDLLVLDEPVSALDPGSRRDFLRELMDDVIERGTTVVFSTHILSDLERVALDIAILKDGRIALAGATDELLETVFRLAGPESALAALRLDAPLRRDSAGLVARLEPAQRALLAREHPSLRIEPLGMEELFLEVTR